MNNRYTEDPSYEVVHITSLDRDGRRVLAGHKSVVVKRSREAERTYRFPIAAACTSRKAANAARRLLSGECERT